MAVKVTLKKPYLIFLGDVAEPSFAKTGAGVLHWRRDAVAGQLRFAGCNVDLGAPDMSIDEAKDAGVGSLLVGVAPVSGALQESWTETLIEAATAGLDIVSGLHIRMASIPELAAAAADSGAQIIDVRVPPDGLSVATGKKRRGKRLLTVGTDCAVGKKYTALSMHAALKAAGAKATFRATGQTGIMIAGEGLPMDAVVSDFLAGAAEALSPDNDDTHWDVIEGQGSLFHPAYAGVSLGLLHGSQSDAIIMCCDPSRKTISGWPNYPAPTLADSIAGTVELAKLTNSNVSCVGISMNSSMLTPREKQELFLRVEDETGYVCVDPVIDGCTAFVDLLQKRGAL